MIKEIISDQTDEIKLDINQEILDILAKEDMDINQMFILLAMDNKAIGLLDKYDLGNSRIDVMLHQYQKLYIHGFIKQSEDETIYELTEKGKLIAESIQLSSKGSKQIEDSIKKLCTEYLAIFPDIKLPSGKKARCNIVEIEKKMRSFKKTFGPRFKKDYGFTLEDSDILEATKRYVEEYRMQGYKFMSTSSYFIQKREASLLADEIISLKNGTKKPVTNITVQ